MSNIPTLVAIDYYRRPTAQISAQNARLQQRPGHGSPRSDGLNNDTNHRHASISGTPQVPGFSPDAQDKSSRSISRGRQPKRRDTSTNAAAEDAATERATSADSIMNGILHTRVAKRNPSQKKDTRNPSQSNGGPSHAEHVHVHSAPDELEFERVEVISCPSCPIHGRHSASSHDTSKRASDPTGQIRRASEVASEGKAGSDRGVRSGKKDAGKAEGNKMEETAGSLNQETGATAGKGYYSGTKEQANDNKPVPLESAAQMDLSSERQPLRIRSTFNPNHTHIDTALPEREMGNERERQSPSWFTVERKVGG